MPFKSVKLILACTLLTSSTVVGYAQDEAKRPAADPTEIIRSIVQDPAVKNFVGPSENAWDFTVPGAVLGFGPLPESDRNQ
jgi:hypothetical protein